jgi:alkaline phosphatase D
MPRLPLSRTAISGRRSFIGGGFALLASTGLGPIGCATAPRGRFVDDPFTLGVASGDPLPGGVVLWTRLAPFPDADDGGMPPKAVPVSWQIAGDEGFRQILQEGTATAAPTSAHSVHVEVGGLAPGRVYFYRFIAGGVASPIGRTQTAPAPGTLPDKLRIAQVGCQNYEAGFYTAYRHIAERDFDLVVHTGDYIYEGRARRRRDGLVRWHPGESCRTLDAYRRRYALYKSDLDLQAAHAAHPFAPIWDDHEVANNWAADIDGRGRGGSAFAARKAAAFRAWWEHMPLRRASLPVGPRMRIYRGLDFGGLARLSLCDTRQYRTPQPCGGKIVPRCPEDEKTTAQMLGTEQKRWLHNRLAHTRARWNVIIQQVPMAQLDRDRDPDIARYSMDKWDGYRAARRHMLEHIALTRVVGPVVLSGDIHRHLASDLRADFDRPETPVIASEFVNTSISSRGDGKGASRAMRAWQNDNPHIRFALDSRGYVSHTISARTWRADFQALDYVSQRGAPERTAQSFLLEAGRKALRIA